jgi:hypothetical protein
MTFNPKIEVRASNAVYVVIGMLIMLIFLALGLAETQRRLSCNQCRSLKSETRIACWGSTLYEINTGTLPCINGQEHDWWRCSTYRGLGPRGILEQRVRCQTYQFKPAVLMPVDAR